MKGWWVNDKLERIWKEAVVACFKVLSTGICQEGLRKTTKPQSELPVSWPRFEPELLDYEAGVVSARPRRLMNVWSFTSIPQCFLTWFLDTGAAVHLQDSGEGQEVTRFSPRLRRIICNGFFCSHSVAAKSDAVSMNFGRTVTCNFASRLRCLEQCFPTGGTRTPGVTR
jgi:hypothetical protein